MKKYISLFGGVGSYLSTVSALFGGIYPKPKTQRSSKGRKRTVTAAQQKREKVKRKNKRR